MVRMDHTLSELRGSSPSLDSAELTVESCIFHSFDRLFIICLFLFFYCRVCHQTNVCDEFWRRSLINTLVKKTQGNKSRKPIRRDYVAPFHTVSVSTSTYVYLLHVLHPCLQSTPDVAFSPFLSCYVFVCRLV